MSTISFQCYSCNQILRVGADKAGKKAKCPHCATSLTIPYFLGRIEHGACGPKTGSGSFPNLELENAPEPPPQKPVAPPPPPRPAATPPPKQPLRVELVDDDEPIAAVPSPGSRRAPQPAYEELEELPPIDEEPYEDFVPAPRSHRDRPQSPPWFFVRLGFLLAFIGSCVWGGAFALKLIGYLMMSIEIVRGLTPTAMTSDPPNYAFAILLRIGECLSVCGSLTALVGYVFCILGPKERGKLGLAIAVTSVAGLDLLLSLIFKIPFVFSGMGYYFAFNRQFQGFGVPLFEIGVPFGTWLMLVFCQMLFVAELVLFPIYIGLVARDFRRRSHAQTGIGLIFLTGGYGILRLLAWILYYVAITMITNILLTLRGGDYPRAVIWITLILLWLGNCAYIGQAIWYIIYLWKSRDLVQVNGGK